MGRLLPVAFVRKVAVRLHSAFWPGSGPFDRRERVDCGPTAPPSSSPAVSWTCAHILSAIGTCAAPGGSSLSATLPYGAVRLITIIVAVSAYQRVTWAHEYLPLKLFRRSHQQVPLEDHLTLPPEQTLFIIGVARSGTTVLQNALNASPDIFLLGEPDIYDDHSAGFASRYNAMHAAWGNQPAKSSYLPKVLDKDGTWRDHLAALSRHHRWIWCQAGD